VAWSGSAGAGVVHCRVCQVGGQGPTASACRRVHAARGSSRLRFRGRTLFDEPAEQFDDRERAGQIYRLLLAHADLFVCSGAGVIVIGGSVRYPLGIAATAIGRLDDAIRHLRAAIDSGGGSQFQQLGMTAAEALNACTARAATALGLGHRKGRLRPGYDADIVAVDGNPLSNTAAPHAIRAVYVRGTAVPR